MKTKNNIEEILQSKRVRENPFTVPEGYFVSVKEEISSKISAGEQKTTLFSILKPQLSLATTFVAIFLIGYTIFWLAGSTGESSNVNLFNNSVNISPAIEEGFIRTSFIDFFDSSQDSLTSVESSLSQDELLDYITEYVDLITLSYLDVRD